MPVICLPYRYVYMSIALGIQLCTSKPQYLLCSLNLRLQHYLFGTGSFSELPWVKGSFVHISIGESGAVGFVLIREVLNYVVPSIEVPMYACYWC